MLFESQTSQPDWAHFMLNPQDREGAGGLHQKKPGQWRSAHTDSLSAVPVRGDVIGLPFQNRFHNRGIESFSGREGPNEPALPISFLQMTQWELSVNNLSLFPGIHPGAPLVQSDTGTGSTSANSNTTGQSAGNQQQTIPIGSAGNSGGNAAGGNAGTNATQFANGCPGGRPCGLLGTPP